MHHLRVLEASGLVRTEKAGRVRTCRIEASALRLDRSVTRSTFTIDREYDASPSRVFSAFADPDIKSRRFGGPDDWTGPNAAFDFRVGGREHHSGEMDGHLHTFGVWLSGAARRSVQRDGQSRTQ